MADHRENAAEPAWQKHVDRWRYCQECPLCSQRRNIVLARGTLPCDVLFVGEAPGTSEDVLGQPFVGPAGKLLDQIVERAIPATVTTAFTNLVACFPAEAKQTDFHEPQASEIAACRPRLVEFMGIASPRLIVTVGRLADEYLPVAGRGVVSSVDTRRSPIILPVVNITHPAAVLRMPLAQRDMAVRRCIATISTAVEGLK